MLKPQVSKEKILDAIRLAAREHGHPPSRSQFTAHSGITEYHVLKYFPSWREAVRAAGLEPDATNIKLDDDILLKDWGELVRKFHHIPTRDQYRRDGTYSPGVFERHFGIWSTIPSVFRKFAQDKPEWTDVVAILPTTDSKLTPKRIAYIANNDNVSQPDSTTFVVQQKYSKLQDRPTYGNPIDFRGLRHEPVNEQGVVFLFGMIARELGYMVEAVQTGYPDCEAKRQIGVDKWQRVRIEFEFESRNFRDHGHTPDGCDVIVCWRHNWSDCSDTIEVVELSTIIKTLAKSED